MIKRSISSLKMLCQVVTAVSLIFSRWKECYFGVRSGDWLSQWKISNFFALRKSFTVVVLCFGFLSISAVKWHPITFAAFRWIWAKYSPYTSSFTGSYTYQCYSTASTMLHRWYHMLWLRISWPFPSPYFPFPIILALGILISSVECIW